MVVEGWKPRAVATFPDSAIQLSLSKLGKAMGRPSSSLRRWPGFDNYG
jgi:hypothetical protein